MMYLSIFFVPGEPNLKLDTCLCDACYRFVDRKANKPPQKRNKSNMRRSISINQRTMGPCVIQNCTQFARHTVKRKWLLRISKKIAKVSIFLSSHLYFILSFFSFKYFNQLIKNYYTKSPLIFKIN